MGQGRGLRPGNRQRLPRIAVMLAGWLNPPPLRKAIGLPLLALPMGKRGTLLDVWMESFARVRSIEQVRIVVNSDQDAAIIYKAHTAAGLTSTHARLEVIPEPRAWRGPAGLLRDVTADLEDEDTLLVSETSCLPPSVLRPLTELMKNGAHDGALGMTGALRPTGIYAFTARAIRVAPAIGYFDLKEQLLPALRNRNWSVRPVAVQQPNGRVRDLNGYLHAVRLTLTGRDETTLHRIAPHASVSGSAILEGPCIVEEGAVIEDGAVVHESVIMQGATVGGGAVVSQSVVGPLGRVKPREHVIREMRRGEAVGEERRVLERRQAHFAG